MTPSFKRTRRGKVAAAGVGIFALALLLSLWAVFRSGNVAGPVHRTTRLLPLREWGFALEAESEERVPLPVVPGQRIRFTDLNPHGQVLRTNLSVREGDGLRIVPETALQNHRPAKPLVSVVTTLAPGEESMLGIEANRFVLVLPAHDSRFGFIAVHSSPKVTIQQ